MYIFKHLISTNKTVVSKRRPLHSDVFDEKPNFQQGSIDF